MRRVQKKILPPDWLSQITSFDIETTSLKENEKFLFEKLVPYILNEKEKSLTNYFLRPVIEHIVFGKKFSIYHYDDVPKDLFREVFTELGNEKGLQLTRKLHSLFVELLAYKYLVENGFQIETFERFEGSCDLVMRKGNEVFNFEVKFKENPDITISRLLDYIEGFSLLAENEFLRNKVYKIQLKTDNVNDQNIKKIYRDVDEFLSKKLDIYDGECVKIFSSEKSDEANRDFESRVRTLNQLRITEELTDDESIETLIKEIFCGESGHITKMINKSSGVDNFKGCLSWTVPFHMNADVEKIERAFAKLNLDFDLYVLLSGNGIKQHNFFVPKKGIKSTLDLLKSQFSFSAFLTWFALGMIIGGISWISGESIIPIVMLVLLSGISLWTIFEIVFVSVVAVIALKSKNERLRMLAKGDVDNFSEGVINKTFKATTILLGLITAATLCWYVTNSVNALATGLYSFSFLISFLYFWISLILMNSEVSKKFKEVVK